MEPEALEREAQSAIAAASTPDELDGARVRYLGRKSELKQALRGVRDRESGMTLNEVRERLEAAVEARRQELDQGELARALEEESVDVTFPGDAPPRGHLHLITQIRREVEDIFLGLGYEVVDGREVETTYYNFDALNIPPNHPARSRRDTFYLDGETVLRTETSASQIRVMEERDPPVYMISPGRVYRRETTDATRSAIFHQVEGLAVDRGIRLGERLGPLTHFARALFGEDRRARVRTSFFPFTEPAIETDVSWLPCDGGGCAGWKPAVGSG